jgi:hypothetical protein
MQIIATDVGSSTDLVFLLVLVFAGVFLYGGIAEVDHRVREGGLV